MRTVILIAALLGAPALALADASAPEATPPAPAPEKPPPASHQLTEKDLVEKDDYRVSLSLPTEDDRTAWMSPGLRIELALEEGYLFSRGPSPRIRGTTAHLRLRLRMDRWWSIGATLGFSVASGSYSGMRWTAMLEPMFHPLPSLGVSLAVGYGGLSVSLPSTATVPNTAQELVSRTLGPNETMASCTGSAWVGQARLEYLIVVGPLFATGPYVLADTQWTSCSENFGRTDRSTGLPVQGTQWWLNLGGAVGWWFSWR
jgi:hypothetical protein